jgi:hypothetical protein
MHYKMCVSQRIVRKNEEIFKICRLQNLLKELLTARHWNRLETVNTVYFVIYCVIIVPIVSRFSNWTLLISGHRPPRFTRSRKLEHILTYSIRFKTTYIYAWRWWCRLKHVASLRIAEYNKSFSSTVNTMYNWILDFFVHNRKLLTNTIV